MRSKMLVLVMVMASVWVSGCGGFNNRVDRLHVSCGSDADFEKRYVLIEDNPAQDIDSVVLDGLQSIPSRVTSRGCIELPALGNPEARLLLRSKTRASGKVVSANVPVAQGEIWQESFGSETILQTALIDLACPSEQVLANRSILLKRLIQPSPKLVYNLLRYTLRNSTLAVVQKGEIASNVNSIELDAQLREGSYHLEIQTEDAFQSGQSPRTSECKISIDKTSPSVVIKSVGEEILLSGFPLKHLAPGQELKFSVTDASGYQIFGCSKLRKSEQNPAFCEDQDFLPLVNFVVPDQGFWDLYFYAQDQLGQRSPNSRLSFVVYHQEQIKQINLLSNITNLYGAANQLAQAYDALIQASRFIRNLLIPIEKEAVEWEFIKAFWDLSSRLNLHWRTFIGPTIMNVEINPRLTDWVATRSDDEGNQFAHTFREYKIGPIIRDASQAVYGRGGSLWTITGAHRAAVLHYYKNGEPIASWPLKTYFSPRLVISNTGDAAFLWDVSEAKVYKADLKDREFISITKPSVMVTGRNWDGFTFTPNDSSILFQLEEKIYRVNLETGEPLVVYEEPKNCGIGNFLLRGGNEIYLLSWWQNRNVNAPEGKDFPCGFRKVYFDGTWSVQANSPLGENFKPELFNRLAMSLDPEQRYIVLGKERSSLIVVVDLKQSPAAAITVELDGDERFSEVLALSLTRSRFLVRTLTNWYVMAIVDGRVTLLPYVNKPIEDYCKVFPVRESLVCYYQSKGELSIYSTDPDQSLQPTVWFDDSVVKNPSNANATSQIGLVQAFIKSDARTLVFFDQAQGQRIDHLLSFEATHVYLSRNGVYAAVFGKDQHFAVYSKNGAMASGRLSVQGTFFHAQISDDGEVFAAQNLPTGLSFLEVFAMDNDALRLVGAFETTEAMPYASLSISAKGKHAIFYAKGSLFTEPVERPYLVIDNRGRLVKSGLASNRSLKFSRDGQGLYVIRGRSVVYELLVEPGEHIIAQDLPYIPSEVFEGNRLLVSSFNLKNLDILSGKSIVPDGMMAVIEGDRIVLLDTTENRIRIFTPDGTDELLNFQQGSLEMSPFTSFISADPESDHFEIEHYTEGAGFTYKSYTTDLSLALTWLERWMKESN
ncbi:MAG TPA: hypothetical protein VE954_14875 [Oligoflexus sp.]|uniref:hypothetical protein n=1 Tax=Oligoflexus sp. TaxID=1971216 RepID=UPI002D5EF965|nr:hypothetical protein [Oligoflexus sp.]HYX34385.1 hypothetical protein [Oligoflexus sp.]